MRLQFQKGRNACQYENKETRRAQFLKEEKHVSWKGRKASFYSTHEDSLVEERCQHGEEIIP